MSSRNKKGFRYDINFLRFISIAGVGVFHYNNHFLAGGFTGVDIFLVISGFLMTKIIYKSDSLLGFYKARLNRVAPVLSVVLIFILVYGYFLYYPDEYKTLAINAFSSQLFLSNLVYCGAGFSYFKSGIINPLLHTWSLSLEFQFYILYGFTLFYLKRKVDIVLFKKLLIPILAILFGINIYISATHHNIAYYTLLSRGWEFLIGALAHAITANKYQITKKRSCVLFILGVILITLGLIFIRKSFMYPSYYSLLPTLGAFCILIAKFDNKILLQNSLVYYLGVSSYSIYLWHYVIFILLSYSTHNNMVLYLFLSISAGLLSYYFIENITIHKLFSVKILCFLSICICSVFIYQNNGIPNRKILNTKSTYLSKFTATHYYRNNNILEAYNYNCSFHVPHLNKDEWGYIFRTHPNPECLVKDSILLWGDSHTQSLSYGIRKVFPKNIPFSFITSAGCHVKIVKEYTDPKVSKLDQQFTDACTRANYFATKAMLKYNFKIIVIAQSTGQAEINMQAINQYLKEHNLQTKIILLGPLLQWDIDNATLPQVIAKRHFDVSETRFKDQALNTKKVFLVNDKLHAMYDKSTSIKYISISDKLCQKSLCLAKVDNANTPIAWDYGHLTLQGSIYIAKHILIDPILKEWNAIN